MTPKEKAKELYSKFYQMVLGMAYPEYNAKQCALIAVDEILKWIEDYEYWDEDNDYWQQVKNEIEKL